MEACSWAERCDQWYHEQSSLLAFPGYNEMWLWCRSRANSIGAVKMREKECCTVCSDDGLRLYSSGDRGSINTWGLRTACWCTSTTRARGTRGRSRTRGRPGPARGRLGQR